ncbi:UDP-galactopyranose mutase [Plastoroseomonas arctica]|uniref:UDP-galactopyranose mutase n=1 Tax=Plastoroseomonas arctica TaxID=1509237 RepID=A0AAF1KQ06_9PROT|nr:UDP-galactopyranose mutase [Plastoroseomonas arctica]MBR0656833.1 UDP-galactopyranose mutase [Plastoroseomonas arctica]
MTFINHIEKNARTEETPLICFSHLRWFSVFQRPQHLMSRFAAERPTYFFEEPIQGPTATLQRSVCETSGVQLVTPVLPDPGDTRMLRDLLDQLLLETGPATAWYYTPAARKFTDHVAWRAVVFDCMDELSAFRFASPELKAMEQDLMRAANVVFTGGMSLYEARKNAHPNIHCFPSGVDLAHFMSARGGLSEPMDQLGIASPKIGYFGVIDERLDMPMLAGIAEARPDWNLVMIGPVAKLQPSELPQASNIHWLDARDYATLPAYLAHWDVALMPFALNEATRFISPTKAPEYLAGGKRVVSTAIADVVRRFEGMTPVSIAHDAAGFVAAIEAGMGHDSDADFDPVDDLLATISWDGIFARMAQLISACETRRPASPAVHSRATRLADALVVGAGFAGSVMAERLASAGQRVYVIDKRPHIAGNAYDEYDSAGLLVHRYGPHIFHTNSDEVLRYLSRFTAWRPYEHRVLSQTEHGLVPMPINRTTLNQMFGQNLADDEATASFLASLAEPRAEISSARDFVVASVGQELYEKLFYGYTVKQWGIDPSELDRSVTARVPTRTSDDDRYFLDRHQCMPYHGYTRMFENMLDHPNITVLTGTDYATMPRHRFGHMVFTGPVDQYFGHRFGELAYRSLVFEHETRAVEYAQPVATVNFPSLTTPYTRCTEFKHMTGQAHPMTSLCYERSSAEGDPYYPVPNPKNHELYKRYEMLADAEPSVTFLGRLGTYRYMNMDQVVGQALATARRLLVDTTERMNAAE